MKINARSKSTRSKGILYGELPKSSIALLPQSCMNSDAVQENATAVEDVSLSIQQNEDRPTMKSTGLAITSLIRLISTVLLSNGL